MIITAASEDGSSEYLEQISFSGEIIQKLEMNGMIANDKNIIGKTNNLLICANYNGISIYDIFTLNLLGTIDMDEEVMGLSVSGRYIAFFVIGRVCIYDLVDKTSEYIDVSYEAGPCLNENRLLTVNKSDNMYLILDMSGKVIYRRNYTGFAKYLHLAGNKVFIEVSPLTEKNNHTITVYPFEGHKKINDHMIIYDNLETGERKTFIVDYNLNSNTRFVYRNGILYIQQDQGIVFLNVETSEIIRKITGGFIHSFDVNNQTLCYHMDIDGNSLILWDLKQNKIIKNISERNDDIDQILLYDAKFVSTN